MGVDHADAAILVDVVAAEEQIAHLEAELSVGVAGRVPDLRARRSPTTIMSPSLSGISILHGGIGISKLLRLDRGEGHDLVAAFQRLDAERMGGHFGLEALPWPGPAPGYGRRRHGWR